MAKFLLWWNGLRFPADRLEKHGTKIERFQKNPQKFKGARLVEANDRDSLLESIGELQNIDPCGWDYSDGGSIWVYDEQDSRCADVYFYPVKWTAEIRNYD